ncbi:hypothetical protein ZPR_2207 [Zunongwangia profunda SM-A87]|uniref:Uncharacterized protein n=4 Tax=Zunongwangia profunda TaxID=398743 RepID=D5BBT3_ZUNPS|nr:hypothetical protein ZPR_2207 [Zunongwangia profunda SM-A87]HAJ81966.1 hypothetical protein [Zunongwangia profunda]HCV83009.1 hypothetical protein [Zunongwangia profunda]|tara:strand:+ start:127 stop:585 length:459 start_codon:yes stop_codon:yes gene_type:complete
MLKNELMKNGTQNFLMEYEQTNTGKNTISVIEGNAHDWFQKLEIIDFELLLYKSYLQDYYSGKMRCEKSTINSLLSYICRHIEQNKFHLRTCLYYKNRISKIRECDDMECEQIYMEAHSLFKKRLQDHFIKIKRLKHQIISKTLVYSELKID